LDSLFYLSVAKQTSSFLLHGKVPSNFNQMFYVPHSEQVILCKFYCASNMCNCMGGKWTWLRFGV